MNNTIFHDTDCGERGFYDLHYACDWQLTNPNGSDCTFEDQTEETKLAIYELAEEYLKTLTK